MPVKYKCVHLTHKLLLHYFGKCRTDFSTIFNNNLDFFHHFLSIHHFKTDLCHYLH